MKYLLAAFLVVAGLCAAAAAEKMSPRAFTEEYAKAVRAEVPSAVVTVTKDLEFTTRFADGRTTKTTVTGAYDSYSKDPQRLASLIQAHIVSLRLPNSRFSASGPEPQAKLSARAFTDEFIKALKAALPAATIAVTSDLQVVVQRGERTATVNLANFYTIYSREPERLKELIQSQVAVVVASSGQTGAPLDHARIIPLIKDRRWLREVQEQIKATGAQQEQLIEELNSELVIAYAEDSEHAMRPLTTQEYSGDRSALRALAIKNLLRVLPKIEMRVLNPHVSIISAGEDYTPSLLLLDDIWSGDQIKVRGEIVVAVPARDVILVTGSGSGTMTNFRAFAADLYAKGPHSITDALFVYRNNRFVKYGRN